MNANWTVFLAGDTNNPAADPWDAELEVEDKPTLIAAHRSLPDCADDEVLLIARSDIYQELCVIKEAEYAELCVLRRLAVAHAALLAHYKSLPGTGATPEVFASEAAVAELTKLKSKEGK